MSASNAKKTNYPQRYKFPFIFLNSTEYDHTDNLQISQISDINPKGEIQFQFSRAQWRMVEKHAKMTQIKNVRAHTEKSFRNNV